MNWAQHKVKWSSCDRCILHERRKTVVLLRGNIPATILFIGEAPGVAENTLGRPFTGPAGKLLQYMIEQSGVASHKYALTNLVGCIPFEKEHKKIPEPSKECIKSCEPRLMEVYRMCKPKLIVAVGKLAAKHMPSDIALDDNVKIMEIIHPAAILRADESIKMLTIQRTIIQLEDAISILKE